MKIYNTLIIGLLLAFVQIGKTMCQDVVEAPVFDTTLMQKNQIKNIECFSKGLENKYSENNPVAIEYFEKALTFNPKDDASMYELSELYVLEGNFDKAFKMIQDAVALQPDNKWYQVRLAGFYRQLNKFDEFIAIYDKLLESDPTNTEYLEIYIDVLLGLERYEKAIEKLNVLEADMGVNEFISLQKIEIYKQLGNSKKVVEEMERLSSAYPFEVRYLSMLAETYMNNKREKDAYKTYLKIKELDPEDPYINISLLEYYIKHGEIEKADNEFLLAVKNKNLDYNTKVQIYEFWVEKKTGTTESDTSNYKLIEEVGKTFIDVYPDKEIGYYIVGTVYFNMDEYAKARDMYIEGLEKDSTNFVLWYQLGFVEMNLNEYEQLDIHASKALKFFPEQPMFHLFKGVARFQLKQYDDAIKYFASGRKMSADKQLSITFDTYTADCHHLLGNKPKAYEYYEKVINADPNNVYVLNNYAYYLSLDNKDLEKALQMSAKTVEAEPKNATYIDTYAWILYKLERYKEAKAWMEKVFSYDKNPEGVNYEHYGDILYKMGDVKKAVQNWKKAKKLNVESEFIDKKIKDEKLYE